MPENSKKYQKAKASWVAKPTMVSPEGASWMPKIVDDEGSLSLARISVQNFLSPQAIIEYKGPALDGWMNTNQSVCWIEDAKHFYKNLKFMVFKVKERSIKDYDRYRKSQIARAVKTRVLEATEDPSTIDFNLNQIQDTKRRVRDVFGYNWPYDDFSLFEAVKIDLEMEIDE